MKKSGATLARFALEQLGVTHTLGIPGVHNSELHDELNASPNIQPVLVTHECGAACMADAYSSAGQRIGTSVIVPAAGVTHAASGIGEASLDGIDQHSLLAPIYKASFRIENHRDVIPALHRAYQIATGREPGQVLIQKRSSCTDRPALGPSGQAGVEQLVS
jgi:acetolactate synthase-1/2/3 large subunit